MTAGIPDDDPEAADGMAVRQAFAYFERLFTPAPNDDKILELFREWRAAQNEYGALNELCDGDDESDECKAAWERISTIEAAIAAIPAAGAIGLALKTYLWIFGDFVWVRDGEHASIGGLGPYDDPDKLDVRLAVSLLKDMVRAAPELGALTADYISCKPHPHNDEAREDAVRRMNKIENSGRRVIGFGEPDGDAPHVAARLTAGEKPPRRTLTPEERELVAVVEECAPEFVRKVRSGELTDADFRKGDFRGTCG
jgi:hypothetical protein